MSARKPSSPLKLGTGQASFFGPMITLVTFPSSVDQTYLRNAGKAQSATQKDGVAG